MEPVPDVEEAVREFFRICQRRKRAVFTTAAAVLLVSACVCVLTTRRYTASCVIPLGKPFLAGQIPVSSTAGPSGASDNSSVEIDLKAQADILQSEALALKVIKDLNLDRNEDFKPLFGPVTWALGLVTPHEPGDPANESFEDSPTRRDSAVGAFRANLKVKVTPAARLLKVNYTDRDPKVAAAVVNDLVKALVDYRLQTNLKATSQVSQWIEGQSSYLRKQSEDLQPQLIALRKGGHLGGRDHRAKVLYSEALDRLQQSTLQLLQAQMNCVVKASVAEVVTTRNPELISRLSGTSIVSSGSQDVANSVVVIQDLLHREAALQERIDHDSSPKLAGEQASLKDLQQSLQEEIRHAAERAQNDLETASKEEQGVRATYEMDRTVAEKLSDKSIEYAALSNEADRSQQLYQDLLKRLKEAGTLGVPDAPHGAVVDRASAPAWPNKPRVALFLAMGAGWGVFFGCCGALLVDAVDNRMKEAEEFDPLQIPLLSNTRRIEAKTTGSRAILLGSQPGQWTRAHMTRNAESGVDEPGFTERIGQARPANRQPSGVVVSRLALTPGHDVAAKSLTRASGSKLSIVTSAIILSPALTKVRATGKLLGDRRQAAATTEGKVVEAQPAWPPIPAPQLTSESQADHKGGVVLAIGLPGSGKTSWFKRRGVTPLSSEILRGILFDDVTEPRYQGLVRSALRSLLRARLVAKVPWNYVDATNLSAQDRRAWIKMATALGYEVHAVFFDVPLEACLERNRRRGCKVSNDLMHKMAARLQPPSLDEGFSKIMTVRVKAQAPKRREAGKPVNS